MATVEKKKYPRALPHRSPEDIAAELKQWRMRTYYLIGVLALLLLVGVLWAGITIRRSRAARQVEVVNEETTEVPSASSDDSKATKKERYLEALGSVSAAHLFQSYLNIGLVADGVESQAYTMADADETLVSIMDSITQVDAQLTKLAKAGIAAEDRAAIEQLQAAGVLLRIQAKLLQAYWLSGEEEDAQRYHEAREAAWKGIAKMLQSGT